jgi:hypothetical protein
MEGKKECFLGGKNSPESILEKFLRYLRTNYWQNVASDCFHVPSLLCLLSDNGTSTSRMVTFAFAQISTIETLFDCPTILRFPFFDWYAVLLLDAISIPFRNYVERTERNDTLVRGNIVDVTAHQPLLVVIILVLEMHHTKEH